jgi:hypothetical protein
MASGQGSHGDPPVDEVCQRILDEIEPIARLVAADYRAAISHIRPEREYPLRGPRPEK